MKKKTFITVLSLLFSLLLAGCSGTAGKNVQESASASTASVDYANQYIDLHMHLDGAITLDIAKNLAKIQNIKLPAGNDAGGGGSVRICW